MEVLVDGRQAYAYTAGRALDAKLPSVVFVHGAANDHSAFLLQSRYFAYHGCNALAVDLPGHGRSAGPPLATIGEMGDWVASLLEAARIETAALVGHSMGSLVVLECAARHPERARALALIGTSAPMPVGEVLMAAARDGSHAALDMLNIWGHSGAAHLGGNTVPGIWMMGAYVRLLERAQPQVLYTDLKACQGYGDGLASAARVKCPTLFVLGRRDLMTPPRNARDLSAAIAGARTALLEGAGHSLMAERPDAVLDALIGFVAAPPR
jgi:pimeloyl-ACP methyl ester carboxylesterase